MDGAGRVRGLGLVLAEDGRLGQCGQRAVSVHVFRPGSLATVAVCSRCSRSAKVAPGVRVRRPVSAGSCRPAAGAERALQVAVGLAVLAHR